MKKPSLYKAKNGPQHHRILLIVSHELNWTSWLLVRTRTIPTERPPLVGEVSANFLRIKGVAWSAQRIPTAVNLGLHLKFYIKEFHEKVLG
jgi:hypothetical protein